MEKGTWKITLADGTSLDNLELNGNNYISSTAVTEETFAGNLSNVTIEGPDGSEVHEDMKLIQITKVGKKYWFILADKSAEEKQKEANDAKMAEMEQTLKALLTGEV